ncbi:putative ribonuclease H-like domain-containing protein [Tanacetum coccineum]
MTKSSTSELFTPYKEPEREFRSLRRHFKTLSLDELRSPNFNLLSDQEYSEEEEAEAMAETMKQYMSKTRTDYGSGVARPKIDNKDQFELKVQFLKELRENTFRGLDNENANEHIEKVLEITAEDAKKAIQEMAEYSKNGIIENLEEEEGDIEQQLQVGNHGPKFTKAYEASHINNTIPRKEKDPGSFTLPYFINDVCFDNALVNLGASISVMPRLTYLNLGLGELAHTRLTVELADSTVKYPKGIAENVLVGIGKFTFLVEFIILDMLEDIKVLLILERPFLPTARAKIDVYKRKITLRVGKEKIIFKSVKPASSIIKRVYVGNLSTTNLNDATVYAFLANQPNESQLVHEDLEQIHQDDLEEMDLKWQLALMSMRTRRFFQKTSRKITINGSDTDGYDKSKVECFNCHKLGHFIRECRGPRNQDSRNWNQDNSRRTVNVEENSCKAMLAIDGAATYKKGLASVEEQLVFYKKNEVIFCEQLVVLKRDISYKDSEISVLKSELEKLKQEKESNQLKIENFDNASKSLDKLIGSQITDKNRKEEFQQPEFEGYGPKTSKSVNEDTSNEVRESLDALLVEELVPNDKLEKKTVFPIVIQKKRSRLCCLVMTQAQTGNMSYLSDFKEFDGGYVTFGGGAKGGRITGKGILKTSKLDFEDVYFVKELQFNLFSVSQMCDKKNNVLFTDTGCFVLSPNFKLADESQVLLKVPRKNNMYSVDMKSIIPKESLTCLVAKATLDELMLWYKRLGHVNFKTINKLVKDNLVKGLPIKHFENDQTYVPCLKGKQHKASSRTPQQNGVAERRNRTLIKAARTMLDDSKLPTTFWAEAINTTCYVQNRVLVVKPHNKTPYELFRGITPSLSFMRPFRFHVTILNTLDHLGKFDGKSDDGFFVGYSLNSRAFRVYNIRTRKVEKNLHVRFLEDKPIIVGYRPKWLFDIDVLIESMNYLPVIAGTNSNDFIGTKESIGAGQSKKETRSSQYYILMPLWKNGSLVDSSSKNASNDEPQPSSDAGKKDDESKNLESGINDQEKPKNSSPDVNTVVPNINTASINTGSLNINIASPTVITAPLEATHVDFFGDEKELDMSNISITYQVPSTPISRIHKDHSFDNVIGDVLSSVQTRRMTKSTNEQGFISAIYEGKTHDDLYTSIQEELLQFNLQKVWILVDLPNARLVAHRYTQEKGIDYDEVSAPVARIKSIRLFLAYSSFMGFMVYQMDVKSTFLYGTIEEEVYVCQPLGFEDPDYPDKVYKVVKALYGLYQAPRAWYETLANYLLDNGFHRGKIDQTLFIKKQKGDILLIQVYVDDIIFNSTKKEMCTEFEKQMHDKFQMSSIRELTFFLGFQVKKKEDGIFISQDKYVAEILRKFSFTDVKTASTLMDIDKTLLKDLDGDDVDVYLYRSMIGSLMHLTSSRPDIMFAVCACIRFEVSPKASHLHAVKRIFRYLKGQPKLGLWYLRDSSFDLVAYSDSDYAGASLDRKFTTGGC